jgi:phenylacetate-coenzyme A ligase PaaK-like adenylate-forming protein
MFDQLRSIVRAIATARRSARMSRAALEADKLVRFRDLARFAKARSPFYADIIKARGIDVDTCAPADFPVLTKAILMENFDAIVTDPRVTKDKVAAFLTRSKDPNERFLNHYTVMHTSGTSGEVGYFLYSPADLAAMAGMMFGRRRTRQKSLVKRRNRGRIRLGFYGATGGHFAGVTSFSMIAKGPMRPLFRLGLFEINAPIQETLDQLNAFQPDMLSGYTTALRMLAEKQKAGELDIHPMAIAATGETVTAADMDFLSQAFGGAAVTSAYGCTEHLGLGRSNPGGETMTLSDDNLIFEFHDDHSVITNLFNHTMPLIRYRMGDVLKPVSGPDDRDLVIENLVGRTELTPTFTTRNGAVDFISPHIINEIFVAGVARFQLRLTGETSFRFLVCLEAGLDAAATDQAIVNVQARLAEILAQKAMDNVTFEVETLDAIPLDPRTRKFRLIVDERGAALTGAAG